MVRREHGLKDQTSKADPILGFSDRITVKLDLDNMNFKSAKDWAMLALEKFKLEGFIILKSSKKCYHVVFDRYVSWDENLSIVAWVAILSKSLKLKDYLGMQCIKMSSTLRVAPKGKKPSPRIVYRFDSQDHAVKDFLEFRQLIKRIHSHGKNKYKN
jgi:hypothetical protein